MFSTLKVRKPTDMKSHLALKCSEVSHNIKIEYLHMIKNDDISSQQSTQIQ